MNKYLLLLLTGLSLVFFSQCTKDLDLLEGEVGSPQHPSLPGDTTTDPDEHVPLPQPVIDLEASMVEVEGGTFVMGCTAEQDGDCYLAESPPHNVTLDGFYISKYVVTQKLWVAVMGQNPSGFSHCEDCPANNVSYNEVNTFISELNKMTGRNYRLPTEAQWEYAARGGHKATTTKFAGSNYLDSVAWYADNSGNSMMPVGLKKPNELGLYDMNGNVWEWCLDRFREYTSAPQVNPIGSTGSSSTSRVVRGGSYLHNERNCRVSNRRHFALNFRALNYGFRLSHEM